MAIRIVPWLEHTHYLSAFKEIFFTTSSRQKFADHRAKENFFNQWTQYYFRHCPEQIYLAHDHDRLCAYLTGCNNSEAARTFYKSLNPCYDLFQDLFEDYPCHLHINAYPNCSGKGIGSSLIRHYIADLKKQNLAGLHIITSPTARNVGFYKQNGFDFQLERFCNKTPLLFMGTTF